MTWMYFNNIFLKKFHNVTDGTRNDKRYMIISFWTFWSEFNQIYEFYMLGLSFIK